MIPWTPNRQNTIRFVLVDDTETEVSGLGSTFSLLISKPGGSFVAGTGVKSEVGYGWYQYVSTATEADTRGPIAVVIEASASNVQQNLEYVVGTGGSNTAPTLPTTYSAPDCIGGDPAYSGPEFYDADPAYT